MPTFLPTEDGDYSMVPDLVVMDVAYCYTGLRDSKGHRILRRVSRPIGFIHHPHQIKPEYVSEPHPADEPEEVAEDMVEEDEENGDYDDADLYEG